uniref:Actin related protein 2/3 complex subunit 1A n=1 Tax=Rhinopithecus bieti TaxID=61621 RepID=A0A2K6L927_RHIBE
SPEVHGYSEPCSCHCTPIALSPNNHEVHIYKKNGSQWVKAHELKEHNGHITGIDWAPKSDRIVTCGADRNAYVWSQKDGVWKPTLVILRINRAATFVKWSPLENKFAVGSGARLISVLTSELFLSLSIEFTFCVKSQVERNQLGGGIGGRGKGGASEDFLKSNSLLHLGITNVLVFRVSTLKTEFLPLLSVSFVSENSVVAAGHDCCQCRNMSAMERFRQHGTRDLAGTPVHQNSNHVVSIYEVDKQDCRKFCTTGIDGAMTIWDFKTLESSIQGLRIM